MPERTFYFSLDGLCSKPVESFNLCIYKIHAMDSDRGEYKNHPHGDWLLTVFIAE